MGLASMYKPNTRCRLSTEETWNLDLINTLNPTISGHRSSLSEFIFIFGFLTSYFKICDALKPKMKLTNHSSVPVYTISGSSTARPLPEWLARKRKRSLKQDPEFANRIELLQDFEFEEASACVRISDDGDWVVSTGIILRL